MFSTKVLGDQKNRLTETVLLSTHNIHVLVEKYGEKIKIHNIVMIPVLGMYIIYIFIDKIMH